MMPNPLRLFLEGFERFFGEATVNLTFEKCLPNLPNYTGAENGTQFELLWEALQSLQLAFSLEGIGAFSATFQKSKYRMPSCTDKSC